MIWDSHSSDYIQCCLPRCDVQFASHTPPFLSHEHLPSPHSTPVGAFFPTILLPWLYDSIILYPVIPYICPPLPTANPSCYCHSVELAFPPTFQPSFPTSEWLLSMLSCLFYSEDGVNTFHQYVDNCLPSCIMSCLKRLVFVSLLILWILYLPKYNYIHVLLFAKSESSFTHILFE